MRRTNLNWIGALKLVLGSPSLALTLGLGSGVYAQALTDAPASVPTPNTQETFVGTPLPAPPPSLPSAKIARGVWRGTFRLDAALNWSVPIPADGTERASGDLYGLGAELAGSLRLISHVALGLRWGVSPHLNQGPNARVSWLFDARVANRVMLFARGYWPSKGRIQPFGEIAGGVMKLDAFGRDGSVQGGAWGAALGADLWILPGWSLWGAARYRGTFVYGESGHRVEAAFGASLHF